VDNKRKAVLHTTIEDSENWLWAAINIGIFSFSSAWNVSRATSPQFEWTDMVWGIICPKMS